jgi:hypothetical protein
MYLTAQHVVSTSGGREGINAFCYSHGTETWMALPPAGIPDQNPGILKAQSLAVPPGGNRVRSYLDIITPDESSWTEIRQAFMTFVSANQRQPFPWQAVVGRTSFRIGIDHGLVGQWHREIADLYRAAQAVRVGG